MYPKFMATSHICAWAYRFQILIQKTFFVLNDRSFDDLKVVYIDSTCVDKPLIGWGGD